MVGVAFCPPSYTKLRHGDVLDEDIHGEGVEQLLVLVAEPVDLDMPRVWPVRGRYQPEAFATRCTRLTDGASVPNRKTGTPVKLAGWQAIAVAGAGPSYGVFGFRPVVLNPRHRQATPVLIADIECGPKNASERVSLRVTQLAASRDIAHQMIGIRNLGHKPNHPAGS